MAAGGVSGTFRARSGKFAPLSPKEMEDWPGHRLRPGDDVIRNRRHPKKKHHRERLNEKICRRRAAYEKGMIKSSFSALFLF
jgi:hypothetical protein